MIPKSYLDLDEAQSYFDTRLHSDVWNDATEINQTKALISATRIIDNLRFKGHKTVVTQEFQFPRYPATIIPNNIIIAICEIAIVLLDDIDMEHEIDALQASGFKYATIQTNYPTNIYPTHIMAGVPSAIAWRYLQPYLASPLEITLSRIN